MPHCVLLLLLHYTVKGSRGNVIRELPVPQSILNLSLKKKTSVELEMKLLNGTFEEVILY